MEFITKNWLAIISLLVALIGGIPGIIAVINQRKNRPIFTFSLVNLIIGESRDEPSGETRTMVLLTGTASNQGASVLSPACFELECKISGTWIKFEKRLIPEGASFQSDVQDLQLSSAWKTDLQRFNGSVTKGMPLTGHLMFLSPAVPLEELRGTPVATPTTYPKHGLTATPRT